MNKIIIFWIEDNPIIENYIEVNGFQVPKLFHTDFFSYCLFQHPKEVEEYLQMISQLSQNNKLSGLSEVCPQALPDLVVFDYKLSDNLSTRNKSALNYAKEEQYNFLKNNSANYGLKSSFDIFNNRVLFMDREDVKEENYSVDELKKELNTEENIEDDEFGLYCGITILREFKDYITCGIPATINKADKSTMSNNSLFYEWLNSYDIKDAIARPMDDYSKSWKNILNFASGKLRIRLFNQIKSNIITPNITQLISYADSIIPKEIGERKITFNTKYGKRNLPLDGLFIDIPEENRDKEIQNWAIQLLSVFKSFEFRMAKEAALSLIKTYKSTSLIQNRIRLSDLIVKLCNNESLNQNENQELSSLCSDFSISKEQIDLFIQDFSQEVKISNKGVDFRDIKTGDQYINRLIVLFVDIFLHYTWQQFCILNTNSKIEAGIISELKKRPTIEDLRFALFPLPKSPLILPYHQHLLTNKNIKKKDPFDAWDSHLDKRKMKSHAIFSKTQYPRNITESEKQLCRCLSLETGLKYEYYPVWL